MLLKLITWIWDLCFVFLLHWLFLKSKTVSLFKNFYKECNLLLFEIRNFFKTRKLVEWNDIFFTLVLFFYSDVVFLVQYVLCFFLFTFQCYSPVWWPYNWHWETEVQTRTTDTKVLFCSSWCNMGRLFYINYKVFNNYFCWLFEHLSILIYIDKRKNYYH